MLQVTQNYIINVKKPRLYPTQLLYDKIKLPNIRLVYIFQSIIFIHTTRQLQHGKDTRAITNKNVEQLFFSKSICQKFISYVGTKLYDAIPNNIRTIQNLKTFKYKVNIFKVKIYLSSASSSKC